MNCADVLAHGCRAFWVLQINRYDMAIGFDFNKPAALPKTEMVYGIFIFALSDLLLGYFLRYLFIILFNN